MLYAIGENLVSQFKYWDNGSIQEGMNYQGQLYVLVQSHAVDAQWEAYELGRELAETGIGTCLTFSAERFAVWIDLKSLPANFASARVNQSAAAIHPFLNSMPTAKVRRTHVNFLNAFAP